MIDLQHQILDRNQTLQKIRRLAYQVYENNAEETDIILAGIHENGYVLAQLVAEELTKIAPISLRLVGIKLDKMLPLQSEITLDCESADLEGKTIIIFDDVLSTGRTLAFCLKPFLNIPIKKIQSLVLVDRELNKFPVSADYVGYTLSTTVNQHVSVIFEEANFGVYLY